MFDFKKFVGDFRTYINSGTEPFNGDCDDLYYIYSCKYIISIIDANTEEENKQIAEELGICKKDSDKQLYEPYSLYAVHAYGSLWNSVLNEFTLHELDNVFAIATES